MATRTPLTRRPRDDVAPTAHRARRGVFGAMIPRAVAGDARACSGANRRRPTGCRWHAFRVSYPVTIQNEAGPRYSRRPADAGLFAFLGRFARRLLASPSLAGRRSGSGLRRPGPDVTVEDRTEAPGRGASTVPRVPVRAREGAGRTPGRPRSGTPNRRQAGTRASRADRRWGRRSWKATTRCRGDGPGSPGEPRPRSNVARR